MTDPAGLKLPLRVIGGAVCPGRFFIVDADGSEIAMAYDDHRAKVIVAALTADAEGAFGCSCHDPTCTEWHSADAKKSPCHPECVAANLLGESMMLHVEGCPNWDAEKEPK